MILINKKMQTLLDKNELDLSAVKADIPEEFSKMIEGGLTSSNDTLLLTSSFKMQKDTPIHRFFDLTEYECFINEINVDGYLVAPSMKELLKVSVACLNEISVLLKNEGRKAKIICSVSDDEYLTSTIRFHSIREGQGWLSDDLDHYEDEGIMVVDTDQ